MSSPYPWFPFYPADFLTDTMAMSHQAVGAYTRLLCYQWINGMIPAHASKLIKIIGCTEPQFQDIWDEIAHKFMELDLRNDWLANKRLEIERNKSTKITDERRKAGIASGKARRKSSQSQGSRTVAPTKHEQNTNHPQSQYTFIEDKNPQLPSVAGPPRGKKKCQLPANWKPDQQLLNWAAGNHPNVNVAKETQLFKDHAQATGRLMKDWRAAWRMWIGKSLGFGGSGGQERITNAERIARAFANRKPEEPGDGF